jgi:NifB/MoaA-like Fe-S oxidoreductase
MGTAPISHPDFPHGLPVAVDGHEVSDLIDWRWWTDEPAFEVAYADGTRERVQRDPRTGRLPSRFDSLPPIADRIRTCANDCAFCFLKQLPGAQATLRPSLYVKDDDYRLSFLEGNFVTLSNLSAADLARIEDLRLSPLYVSLHAVDPALRERMLGRAAARGLANLERLMTAGIDFHLQIVLVPGQNDGEHLQQTLTWAQEHDRALTIGVVPFGYTKYSELARQLTVAEDAIWAGQVIEQCRPFDKAMLADAFFLSVYGEHAADHLPPASYYHDYSQYENGIGMLRYWLDSLSRFSISNRLRGTTLSSPGPTSSSPGLSGGSISNRQLDYPNKLGNDGHNLVYITGEAFAPILRQHTERPVVAVRNDFFGGNVNVAGLLTAADVIAQVPQAIPLGSTASSPGLSGGSISFRQQDYPNESGDDGRNHTKFTYVLPAAMFNDDGLTLDGHDLVYIEDHLGARTITTDGADLIIE